MGKPHQGKPPIQRIVAHARSHVPSDEERRFYADMIETLKVRRRALGLTQEQLDNKLGVANHQVAKWESFQKLPGAFMMMCWASALGVKLVVGKQET